jgi:ATP-binding cassette, subfamily B, multidrug efflux pump
MHQLAKYLKPFLWQVVVAIALLFVQANCDLALPDYMSQIVNVGIQQGGVENAVPQAIRQSEMNRLTLFFSAADGPVVLGAYTLVDRTSPDYARLVNEYPALAQQPVYVLKAISQADIARLNPVMGKALLAVSGVEQMLADPAKAAALGQAFGFDLSKLPPGADVFTLLGSLPAAQRSQITGAISQKFAALGDSMITQSAVAAIQREYRVLGLNTSGVQTSYMLRTGLLMLLVTLLSVACTILVGLLASRVAAGLSRDMRRAVFTRVESFSNVEFDRFSTASLITRSTNDITQIQMVTFIMMRMVFYAPIIGVGGILRAIGKSPSMWWIIALAVVVLLAINLTVFSLTQPRFRIIQNLIDRLNLVAREDLTGMMVIRAFNMQPFEETRFDRANKDLSGNLLFVNRVMVTMMPLMMILMNGLSLLIVWVGAQQVAASAMQVGDMIAFMQYAMQIVFAFMMLSFMFIILPRASISISRIAEVLDSQPTILDPEAPRAFGAAFRGVIEFRQVCFRYPGADEDALSDISFTARPGQTTAIIGATGSGKSTTVNLIPRFYDVTGGAIYLDGVDIRAVTQHDLRDKIGYVPQKSNLFSGTIESNLRYADEDARAETVRQAVDIAQASEFIFAKPEGLEAEISQGGANVSGGQKQRLSIARALVKRAPIYIFDDSFSALDFKTDAALRRALKDDTGDSTLFVVTQRISTIKTAEQIIVLDEGRVVGKGTHRELMKSCEIYRDIALSQLSQEELA